MFGQYEKKQRVELVRGPLLSLSLNVVFFVTHSVVYTYLLYFPLSVVRLSAVKAAWS